MPISTVPPSRKPTPSSRFLRELSDRFFAGSAAQLALRALEIEKTSAMKSLEAIRSVNRKKNLTK